MDYDLNIKLRNGREREGKLITIRSLECNLILSYLFILLILQILFFLLFFLFFLFLFLFLFFLLLFLVGYNIIAWNHQIYGKLNQQVITLFFFFTSYYLINHFFFLIYFQIKPNNLIELTPLDYKNISKNSNIISGNNNLRQFTRVTLFVDDINDAQVLSLTHEGLKRFDIVAASTNDGKVFNYLCTTAEIDIISLDFTRRIQFPLNKKTVSFIQFYDIFINIDS